jgi:radical SAM protein with 4Fe4S-binding SPASM domain
MRRYDTAWFQVNLSFLCNANCPYCYVDEKENPHTLSNENIQNLVDFGKFIISTYGVKKIKITFLGGDPLLRLDKVEYLAKKAKEEIPCEVVLWLFTNGIELTHEVASRLKDLGIFILLSANHTNHKDILNRCEIISNVQPVTRVSIAVDRTNLMRLEYLSQDILSRGWHVRYFVENQSFKGVGFVEDYEKVLSSCLDLVDTYVANPVRLIYLYENFDPRVQDDKSVYLVGRSICVFDPDGTVRPATSLKDAAVLGKLGDKHDYFANMINFPNRLVDLPRWSAQGIIECNNCEVRSFCQGGYPPPRWYAYGRFDRPTPYCRAFKKLIPKFVGIYNTKARIGVKI